MTLKNEHNTQYSIKQTKAFPTARTYEFGNKQKNPGNSRRGSSTSDNDILNTSRSGEPSQARLGFTLDLHLLLVFWGQDSKTGKEKQGIQQVHFHSFKWHGEHSHDLLRYRAALSSEQRWKIPNATWKTERKPKTEQETQKKENISTSYFATITCMCACVSVYKLACLCA